MADSPDQALPLSPDSSFDQDPIIVDGTFGEFPGVSTEANTYPHWLGGAETHSLSEDSRRTSISDGADSQGAGERVSFLSRGRPIPGGLWRLLFNMGILQKDEGQAQLLLSVRAHPDAPTQPTCQPTC